MNLRGDGSGKSDTDHPHDTSRKVNSQIGSSTYWESSIPEVRSRGVRYPYVR